MLTRFFHMDVGRDYKVISFQGDPAKFAALINGDIQGALVSAPTAAKAAAKGYNVLIRTGDFIPRAGGSFWGMKKFIDANPDTTKKFIRAIAEGVMYFRNNKAGSIPTLKKHLGIDSDAEAGVIWDQLHNVFGARIPKDLFRKIFESRRKLMIKSRQWPKDKPLPDPEQWVMRKMLDSTLTAMHYVPTDLSAPKTQ